METKEKTRQQTTIRNVRGSELPQAWAQQAGIDADTVVDVTIDPRRQNQNDIAHEEILRRIATLHSKLDKQAIMTDDELYDKRGLPK